MPISSFGLTKSGDRVKDRKVKRVLNTSRYKGCGREARSGVVYAACNCNSCLKGRLKYQEGDRPKVSSTSAEGRAYVNRSVMISIYRSARGRVRMRGYGCSMWFLPAGECDDDSR